MNHYAFSATFPITLCDIPEHFQLIQSPVLKDFHSVFTKQVSHSDFAARMVCDDAFVILRISVRGVDY